MNRKYMQGPTRTLYVKIQLPDAVYACLTEERERNGEPMASLIRRVLMAYSRALAQSQKVE